MIQITIKENNKAAKAFLAFAKTLSFLKIEQIEVEKPRYNVETEKAIKDFREGRGKIIKAKNAKELIEKLNA
ncbi:MAG: hypothetical protein HYU67_03640 [Flavobacteriia bacterium]|nr:hypothetical protein [Flavobacteriia bacterium]